MQAHRQFGGDDQPRQRERMGRAAHVLLHQPHAARRLDVEPAAVEHHALADDGDARVGRLAPFKLDQARLAPGRGGAADRGDQRIVLASSLPEMTRTCAPDLRRLIANRLLQLGRPEVGCRRVDQVADQSGRLGDADAGSICAGSPVTSTRGPGSGSSFADG